MILSYAWAMPNSDTLKIKPIQQLTAKYIGKQSVDPFARSCKLASYTNDLNPTVGAMYDMSAEDFLSFMLGVGVEIDSALFDPPYSARQVKECYESVGRQFLQADSQNCIRWTKEKDLLAELIIPGGHVVSMGWNSTGMGKSRGFEKVELLVVNHGSAHNDTLVLVERKLNAKT